MSFSESTQKKKVNIITFENKIAKVEEIEIPSYKTLLVLKGDLNSIKNDLKNVSDKQTWIEVHLKDENPMFANQAIREYANELDLMILAIKIDRSEKRLQAKELNVVSLDELSPNEVFKRRLDVEELEDDAFIEELTMNFNKVLEKVSL